MKQMCKRAVKTGECRRENCHFKHLKNTKINQRPPAENGSGQRKQEPKSAAKSQNDAAASSTKMNDPTQQGGDFLDVKGLGDMLAVLMTKMDGLLSQQRHPFPQFHYPPPMTVARVPC